MGSQGTCSVTKFTIQARAEPNMLKILPIIPSRTSQKFYILFILFHIITYYCNFYCMGDNNVHNTHSDYYMVNRTLTSDSSYMKYCYLRGHFYHHHFK